MLKLLDKVKLKNEKTMTVKLFVPPEPEFAGKFKHFMRYLSNENTRSVGSRADGKYAACAVDCYFIGEIDGRIAGQVWFGWGKHENPAANFGQVYVDVDFRGLDITKILMKYWLREFSASPVLGAMCTCSYPKIFALYEPSGFHYIYSGSSRLCCSGSESPYDFKDLTDSYYQPTSLLRLIPGTMEYRHEIDCLLTFTSELNSWDRSRVFAASAVTSFQDAVFKQEDGRGSLYVALADNGHCIGWSFCLSPLPDVSTIFMDYEFHPAYKNFARQLVKDTCNKWFADHDGKLFASCIKDSEKMAVLSDAGFTFKTAMETSTSRKTVVMEI